MPKPKETGPPEGYASDQPLFHHAEFDPDQIASDSHFNHPKIVQAYQLTGRLYDSAEQARDAIENYKQHKHTRPASKIPPGRLNDAPFDPTTLSPDLQDIIPPGNSAARNFQSKKELNTFQKKRKNWIKKQT